LTEEEEREILERIKLLLKTSNGLSVRLVFGVENLTPRIIEELKDVESLDLTKNILTEIPDEIGELENLKELNAELRNSDFSDANMSYSQANLDNAILRGAELNKTNFNKAKLRNSDLSSANMSYSTLSQANLDNAILHDANFHGVDLSTVKNLSVKQLGGTNLFGATLPDNIDKDKFEALETLAEISKNARRLFQLMVFACLYCWLAIATTNDVSLLTNSPSSPLPVIRTQVPVVGFYFAAPILLLIFYIYFHFYLQHMWEELSIQPAIFPDGKHLDEKAYPWLMNVLIYDYFERLKNNKPSFCREQVLISRFIGWWLAPLTLAFFWFRYLTVHGWKLTTFHVFLLLISIIAAIVFSKLAAATLTEKRNPKWSITSASKECFKGWRWVAILTSLTSLVITYSYVVINPQYYHGKFSKFYSLSAVDFSEKDVSTKPANWVEKNLYQRSSFDHPSAGNSGNTSSNINLIKGARLRESNLKLALAYEAFLVKADLRGANLWKADLTKADLRNARLQEAKLIEANLTMAKLAGADLTGASLVGATLINADMRRANLTNADFTGADLTGIKLQGAKTTGTKGLKR